MIQLLDNTASLLDMTTATVSITAKQISCSVSRSTLLVSAIAEYQFTITPGSITLPSNTYIIMNFPSSWLNSA